MRESVRQLRCATVILSTILLIPTFALAESNCADGLDNDGDLLIDCLDDSCNGLSCDDGDACTPGDQCLGGACVGGSGDADNDGLGDVQLPACNPDPCPSDALNACYGPAAVDGTTGNDIRINAGPTCSVAFTDCRGQSWATEFGAVANQSSSTCNLANGCPVDSAAVFGCDDAATDALFKCEHWDGAAAPELLYSFNVPDGPYLVNLLFMNSYNGSANPGQRVFDVSIEGAVPPQIDDFDQVVAAGGVCDPTLADCIPVNRATLVTVSDGNGLQIEFLHDVIENPAVKGIEVLAYAGCLVDADCNDGDVCNGAETCNVGVGCVAGTALVCDDNDVCNGTETCDAVAGCQAGSPLACDDGAFCNGAESCDAVSGCQLGTPPVVVDGVACTDDSCDEVNDVVVNAPNDANCDNGLFCDGAETCNPVSGCLTGTPPAIGDGVACTDDSCDEANDVVVNAPNDANCDDGAFCNGAETCDALLDCQAGTVPCGDGIACTDDACDEALDVCGASTPNDANCDDGAFCNGAETCDALLDCQGGTAPTLDDGVACTDDSCDEANDAIVHAPNDANCDDGAFCNGAETCDALLDCQGGTAPTLDDGVACTDDSCDEANDAIVHAANDANCDDGTFCNGTETCDALLDCQGGTAPTVDDGVACTDDSCDEANDTVIHAPNDALCDDGAFCNGAETCDALLDCQAGVDPCNDGVTCTDDSCDDVADTCTNTANDANCDNGLFCDGAETCDALLDCQGAGDPCDDGIGCTNDTCDAVLGTCANVANDANCDDGAFCNGVETCDAALDCQSGPPPSIDDGVGCTNDSCDETTDTIINIANDANCDDGAFCNGVETCDAALDCQVGTPPSCDDGVGCTDDTCNTFANACINLANNALCSNGTACDGIELCDPILDCQVGTPVDCSGLASACADAACDDATGSCVVTPINDGLPCDDGDPCTPADVCAAGACAPAGTVCGDGFVQTVCGEDCDPPSTQACDGLTDGDGDGLIGCLDPDCCNAVVPTCGSDCTTAGSCKPILDTPSRIRFDDGTATRGLFKFRGQVAGNPLFVKPLEETIAVVLSNSGGEIYRGELLPGDLIERGAARYRFKDKTARKTAGLRDGLGLVRMVFRRQDGGKWFLYVKVKAWGDLSTATEALMTMQISGVGDVGLLSATWTQTRRGWKLPRKTLVSASEAFTCTQN